MFDICHGLFAKLMQLRNLDQPSLDCLMFSYQGIVPGNILGPGCGANDFLDESFS